MNSQLWVCEKKILYLSSRVWKTNIFSRRASAAGEAKQGARLGAWLYVSKDVRSYVHECKIPFIQFLKFFFNFWFLWKDKKIVFHTRELK